jgi:hypothetical protein
MKRILTDVATGVGIFLLVMIAEFVVTLPDWLGTGPYTENDQVRWRVLLIEFALAAPFALVISWVVGRWRRTSSLGEGLQRGLIWAAVACFFYLIMAWGNGTWVLFAVPTLYILLAALVAGAVVSGRRFRQLA